MNHTPELKASAVALAMQGDTTIAAVARDLGVSEKSLYERVARAKREAQGGLGLALRRCHTWSTRPAIVEYAERFYNRQPVK